MSLLDKAGSGSVWPEIFNAVVDALRGHEGRQITAAAIDSQAAQDGDVLTADGSGGAAWEVGGGGAAVPFVGVDPPGSPTDGELWWDPDDNTAVGGSQTLKVVNFDFAHDTADLPIVSFAISDVDQGTKTFTVAGDHADAFAPGSFCAVNGSGVGNDGTYTIVSATFVTDHTDIVVVEAIADGTVAGVIYNTDSNVVVYTPLAAGEHILSISIINVATGFNGTGTPTLTLYSRGNTAGDDLVATGVDTPNSTKGTQVSISKTTFGGEYITEDTTPIVAVLDDGASLDPGSSAGAGTIQLLIIPAP